MSEENVRQVYNDFAARMTATTALFINQVEAIAQQVLSPEDEYGCESLVLHSAVSSVLYKLLTA